MKEYYLNVAAGPTSCEANDFAPLFAQRCMKWAKATNEICGLVRGLLADGDLNEMEVSYFREWIRTNQELLNDPLVRSLALRVERVYDDGVVTPEELAELKSLFQDYANPTKGAPTNLPLDNPMPDLTFRRRLYCFTGTFVSGTRKWCVAETEKRGARTCNDIDNRLDFLVIGTKISHAWANQTYGRKIEQAAGLRTTSKRLSIINEDHWLKYLAAS